MTDEHVLIVGGGMDLPRRLREYRDGCRTSVMCQPYIVPRLRDVDGHARLLSLGDASTDDEWVELAEYVHQRDPVTRVASFGERDQLRAARIAARLGLPLHDPATVERVHDKARMRAALRDAGLDPVRSFVADSADALAAWVRDNEGAWIVKPLDGTASAGVSRVDSPDAAAAAYARCQAAEHPGRGERGRVLVEDYLHGRQVSVESMSEHGEHLVVAVTEKFSDARTFVELGHVVPASLPPDDVSAVADHVAAVLTCLGVRRGPCHTEVVLTDEGPRTIETHLRLAGDEIPRLVLDATGVDLADAVVRQTFGEDVLPSVRERLRQPGSASAIWFGACTTSGTVERVDGVDRARGLPGVVEVKVAVAPGEEVRGLHDSNSRPLWVRATAAEPDQALAAAREAVAGCTVVLSHPLGAADEELV